MNSKKLFEEAKKFMPGGVNSPVRAFEPYPFFVERGRGCFIYDIDGNSYIDYCLAYGPLILGHAHPSVVAAVYKQAEKGTTYGTPTEKELKLAKFVVDKVPCAEMVRFVNSGTEATMSAIRLARAFTGKEKIVKFEGAYHGAHDYVLVKPGSGATTLPDSVGIPKETTKNTILCTYNDEESVINAIENHDVAAVLVEPVMGNIGCIKPKKGYLKFLRKITKENDILLIFDEVITGFRLAEGGAQEYYGVTPDLVTLGKVLGGGLPIGALAGKKEIMENIAPSGDVYQAGTFNGNPMTMSAGLATLKHLDKKFYKELNKKGKYLTEGINDIVEDVGIGYLSSVGSMFQIYFTEGKVLNHKDAKKSNVKVFNKYFKTLLKEGIFVPPSQFECCFISDAHDYKILDNTLEKIETSLKKLKNE